MAEKVLMIALSPTMETGTIVKWRKKEGEKVDVGDVLCEVETDKATMEYESLNEGALLKIILPEGKEARIEEPIAVIGEKDEDISELLKEIEGDEETIEKKPGPRKEKIAEGTQKEKGGVNQVPGEAEAEQIQRKAPGIEAASGIKASPLARQMADQNSIDLKLVRGSGPDGRIIKRDIETFLKEPSSQLKEQAVVYEELKRDEIKVTGKRRVIAKRLSDSKYSAPHYYLRTIVPVDNLITARQELNRGRDEKVSFNAFFMKFSAEALRRHRMVNASWNTDTIIRFGSADIGLAVAQPDGLITPIVRDCWNKGIVEIDNELKVLIDKALNNRLKPEEYEGATFTITNLGGFGINEFTAIINPPGSAILATGAMRREPVVGDDDQITIKTNMNLTLSCDHRVIDGAVGALFMKDLKDMMENPIRILY